MKRVVLSTDAGPDGAGGGYPHGAGDYQLMSESRAAPQPQPHLHLTLQQGCLLPL